MPDYTSDHLLELLLELCNATSRERFDELARILGDALERLPGKE